MFGGHGKRPTATSVFGSATCAIASPDLPLAGSVGHMERSSAAHAASDLSAVIATVKRGSLRMFGDWFGGRKDNIHIARSATAEGDDLVVFFNEDEELRITSPDGWEFSEYVFRVLRAERVAWRWYFYGRPKIADNLFTIEHWIDADGAVGARSDETWHTPVFNSVHGAPAAELL